jgi:hypothetical protein
MDDGGVIPIVFMNIFNSLDCYCPPNIVSTKLFHIPPKPNFALESPTHDRTSFPASSTIAFIPSSKLSQDLSPHTALPNALMFNVSTSPAQR